MSDSNGKGYYILYGYPSELKTDQSYTYQMTTSTDGDMTDVTYSFGWKFTCDGVTTEKVIASGLTSLTYTWAPTSVIFGPLMTKSKSGILKVIVKTSTGQMTYVSRDITLTIADSVRPSISNCVINRTAYAYNDKSISNRTIHNLSLGVSGLYGASQTVIVSIGDAVNTIKVDAQTGNQISTASLELGVFDVGTADSVEKTVNITVTDSRGFTTNGTASVTVYGYTPPTLTASVYRDTNQDAYISFTTNYQGTVAGKANNINTFYARCTTGTTMVQTDLKTSPQKLNGTDALENSYNVFVLLMDDVGGKDIKRFVIPSGTPVMDIGADGKTVSFFGTAPESADNLSLQIKDIASFGETIRLGKENDETKTIITSEAFSVIDSGEEMVHFGRTGDWTTDDPQAARGYYFSFGSDRTDMSGAGRPTGLYSFTAGKGLCVSANHQAIVGCYNNVDSNAIFIVGNGSRDSDRSSAFVVKDDGVEIKSSMTITGLSGETGAYLFGANGNGELTLNTSYGTNYWTLKPNGSDFYVSYNGSIQCRLNSSGGMNVDNITATNVVSGNVLRVTTQVNNDNEYANVDCMWADYKYHALAMRDPTGYIGYLGPPKCGSWNFRTVLRGGTVRCQDASGVTGASDERIKEDFQTLDNWESFFDNLEPCAFKYKNGSSGRYHLGFRAQQVKESLEKAGLTTKDFAGFVTTKYAPDPDNKQDAELYEQIGINPGDDIHELIYTEFIALQHNEIQKLKAKVKNLETEINDIKEMIKSKEA